MLARTRTLALQGVDALPVDVEIDIHRGLPAFSLVGLPDAAVRESRERVRSAIVNCGFEFPLKRITANLAPADLRKAGPGFDLAIAAAILCASGQIPQAPLNDWWLAGELALDGSIRSLPGVLAMAEEASRRGGAGVAVAAANAGEASLVEDLGVAALTSLSDLRLLASGEVPDNPHPPASNGSAPPLPDLADLRGQTGLAMVSRSLRPAVMACSSSGRLARANLRGAAMPSILRRLGQAQAVEVTKIVSAAAVRRRTDPSRRGRFARRTTRSRPRGSSAVAHRHVPERSLSRIEASSSSTSSASSPARASRHSGSRSRMAG